MRFEIFGKRLLAINEDEVENKQYVAVSEELIKVGIFVPTSHVELNPEPVGEIDAENATQAVEKYREMMEHIFGY